MEGGRVCRLFGPPSMSRMDATENVSGDHFQPRYSDTRVSP